MLRDLTIFNPIDSINQRKILSEIANIGGGAPSTIWKGNLMGCTRTIKPESTMNGDSTIFNPGESINQRKILPEMAKIGGGAPGTRWKGNLMGRTRTINPERMMNGLKKIIGRENPPKISGPSVEGIVRNQLEIMELKNTHSFLTDSVCTLHRLWNIPG